MGVFYNQRVCHVFFHLIFCFIMKNGKNMMRQIDKTNRVIITLQFNFVHNGACHALMRSKKRILTFKNLLDSVEPNVIPLYGNRMCQYVELLRKIFQTLGHLYPQIEVIIGCPMKLLFPSYKANK